MSRVTVKKTPEKSWPDYPVPDKWIQEGTPEGKGMVLIENKDEGTNIGMWKCTPGVYRWDYDYEEYVHLLKGEVTVTEIGGSTYTLKAGDTAHFPKGTKTIWKIKEPIQKVFFCNT